MRAWELLGEEGEENPPPSSSSSSLPLSTRYCCFRPLLYSLYSLTPSLTMYRLVSRPLSSGLLPAMLNKFSPLSAYMAAPSSSASPCPPPLSASEVVIGLKRVIFTLLMELRYLRHYKRLTLSLCAYKVATTYKILPLRKNPKLCLWPSWLMVQSYLNFSSITFQIIDFLLNCKTVSPNGWPKIRQHFQGQGGKTDGITWQEYFGLIQVSQFASMLNRFSGAAPFKLGFSRTFFYEIIRKRRKCQKGFRKNMC